MKQDLYKLLGYPPTRQLDGALVWEGADTPPSQATRDAISALPDDEAAYQALNLSAHVVATELSPADYATVKAHQVAAIQEKRREDYIKPGGSNDDFINRVFDLLDAGSPLNKQNLAPWLDKVKEVKNNRPFPTP